MFDTLPKDYTAIQDWPWEQYAPFFEDLQARPLNAETMESWFADYSRISDLVYELGARLYIATTVNTADKEAKDRFFAFLEVEEKLSAANNALEKKILASGVEPDNFSVALRSMRGNTEIFREENLPLLTESQKLGNQYDEIMGAQTVTWEGEEKTLTQLKVMLGDGDRDKREKVWRAAYERQLADREAINGLWKQLFDLRLKLAANADKATYRDLMWVVRGRYDYTPAQNEQFLESIREVVVPAMLRLVERRKKMMGVDTLRPWDMNYDPTGKPQLKPFDDVADLISGIGSIFEQLDPELSAFYNSMRDHNLLDLDNRANKAPGGYCIDLAVTQESFIFMNAVGVHDNVQTLLHESGHAFHNYETFALPYGQQRDYPIEFAEVASMSMELLAAPYLVKEKGGFYSEEDAARARIEHLESMIYFWCYMSVVDGFQHWAYTHTDEAKDPVNCDAKWSELWDTYLPGVDWTGLEDIKATGWHRKLHIYNVPFYYIEYGLAQLGAAQVWRNSLSDYDKALSDYRHGLSLGNTKPLPELFAAAGAKLAFDAETLGEIVELIENTIYELEA